MMLVHWRQGKTNKGPYKFLVSCVLSPPLSLDDAGPLASRKDKYGSIQVSCFLCLVSSSFSR